MLLHHSVLLHAATISQVLPYYYIELTRKNYLQVPDEKTRGANEMRPTGAVYMNFELFDNHSRLLKALWP